MPKDKTATHKKLLPIVKDEFITYGYEKASVNRIAATANMSGAGLYRHFKDKEDMFRSLVADTISDLEQMAVTSQEQVQSSEDMPQFFSDEWIDTLLVFIYAHFDGFKLLVCCSAGSHYEHFVDDMIDSEAETCKTIYQKIIHDKNCDPTVSDEEWHLVSSMYIRALFDVVRYDYSREQAEAHLQSLKRILFPGWKALFEL